MTLFRDRLAWDSEHGVIYDGPTRYLLIRADALMGLFRKLPASERKSALNACKDSVAEYGGRSSQRYHEERREGDVDVLSLVVAGASQLGWGSWRLEQDNERLLVTIENSPFASGFSDAGHSVCAPICGMLQATATIAFGHKVEVTEISCTAAGAENCLFQLVHASEI